MRRSNRLLIFLIVVVGSPIILSGAIDTGVYSKGGGGCGGISSPNDAADDTADDPTDDPTTAALSYALIPEAEESGVLTIQANVNKDIAFVCNGCPEDQVDSEIIIVDSEATTSLSTAQSSVPDIDLTVFETHECIDERFCKGGLSRKTRLRTNLGLLANVEVVTDLTVKAYFPARFQDIGLIDKKAIICVAPVEITALCETAGFTGLYSCKNEYPVRCYDLNITDFIETPVVEGLVKNVCDKSEMDAMAGYRDPLGEYKYMVCTKDNSIHLIAKDSEGREFRQKICVLAPEIDFLEAPLDEQGCVDGDGMKAVFKNGSKCSPETGGDGCPADVNGYFCPDFPLSFDGEEGPTLDDPAYIGDIANRYAAFLDIPGPYNESTGTFDPEALMTYLQNASPVKQVRLIQHLTDLASALIGGIHVIFNDCIIRTPDGACLSLVETLECLVVDKYQEVRGGGSGEGCSDGPSDPGPGQILCSEDGTTCATPCDGKAQCPSSSDESPSICDFQTCPYGRIQCPDASPGWCAVTCEGITPECPGGEDEGSNPSLFSCGGGGERTITL